MKSVSAAGPLRGDPSIKEIWRWVKRLVDDSLSQRRSSLNEQPPPKMVLLTILNVWSVLVEEAIAVAT